MFLRRRCISPMTTVALALAALLPSACAEPVPERAGERDDGVASPGGACGVDFAFGGDSFDACVERRCCAELSSCTDGDPDGCKACMLRGGGERCDALLACVEPCVGSSVCDSRVMLVDAW